MLKHSPPDPTPPDGEHTQADAAPLLAWLPVLAEAKDLEDEPARYASPPCYLADFSGEDFAAPTAK